MAELAVYRELEGSEAPGTAIYEAKINRNAAEVDFAIWLEGIARYAMQVKGGIYRVNKGAWYLSTPQVEVKKPAPLAQLWDSTMTLHDCLQERLGGQRNPFFVPVLNLPDMEPDPSIEERAEHTNVHVLFGTDKLLDRLVDLACDAKLRYPPTAEEVAEEVALVMPGRPEPPQAPEPLEIQAKQVVIQHADQVIVYTTGGETGV